MKKIIISSIIGLNLLRYKTVKQIKKKELIYSLKPGREFEGHFPCQKSTIEVVFSIDKWINDSLGQGRISLFSDLFSNYEYPVKILWEIEKRSLKMIPIDNSTVPYPYNKFSFEGFLSKNNRDIEGGTTGAICV